MSQVIGIDFDNTLICYDEVLHSLAVRKEWIPPAMAARKMAIRDTIRQSPGGDGRWQQLQALAYGTAIDQAYLFDGVSSFFDAFKKHGGSLFIVSHKTETALLDQQLVHLRQHALSWMQRRGFFAPERFGLKRDQVFFEPTRSEKINRIRALGCTHFIDDLAEVFAEPGFPSHVVKILFDPDASAPRRGDVRVFESWIQITDWFFRIDGK